MKYALKYSMPLLLKGGTALLNAPEILKRLEVCQGQTVADLGCGGAGHFVGPTAVAVGNMGMVYAADIQRNVLATAKSRLEMQGIDNVVFVRTNLEHYGMADIADGSCDLALLINVLFQNTKHEEIMREATRLLKNGGRLAIIDWSLSSIPFGPHLRYRVKPSTVKDIAQRLKLTFVTEFEPGYAHYGLVFRKP